MPLPAPFVEMVTVGNAGNATDAGNMSEPNVYGAVNYEFKIGKYAVTLAQYTTFLNAVATTDPHGLHKPSMATSPNVVGIERNGTSGSHTYSVIGSGERPVTWVSWFDAARFCNWLHHGRPKGAQDATTTERGAYTLDGATSAGLTISRNPGAKFWIPSEDEWYKAAYHQPAGEGGDGDDYWLFATRSNTAPTAEPPPGGANSANFDSAVNGITPVGAYEGSASFYGTLDQGGNVWEWNDAVADGSFRGLRGGSWVSTPEDWLRASTRINVVPDTANQFNGFRVASP